MSENNLLAIIFVSDESAGYCWSSCPEQGLSGQLMVVNENFCSSDYVTSGGEKLEKKENLVNLTNGSINNINSNEQIARSTMW